MPRAGDDRTRSLPLFARLEPEREGDEPGGRSEARKDSGPSEESEPGGARDRPAAAVPRGRGGGKRRRGANPTGGELAYEADAGEGAAEPSAPGSGGGGAPVPGSRDTPWSVAHAVRRASRAIDDAVGVVWIEGEVSSLSRPASGHLYFALKDERALLRAVMWRSDARRLRFAVEEGQSLRCRGRLGIYQQGGKFQLYVQYAEPAGLGADALALEQLRRALAAEGLFDAARKRPLPHLPRRIGVATSRTGAAVRDIVRAIQRRFPLPILVADTRVQGEGAPAEISAAIGSLCRAGVDVVIVARGGGSAADLAAYNDEGVVRAVAECPVPTISAVGHEVDTSLADLAADQRAATPTMAGEMAVPVRADLAAALAAEERRLAREVRVRVAAGRQSLDRAAQAADHRAHVAIARRREALGDLARRVGASHPRTQLAHLRARVRDLEERAGRCARGRLERGKRRFADLGGRLEALSPLRVLDRGYALATASGRVVADAAEVEPGSRLDVALARGRLGCRVEDVAPGDEGSSSGPRGGAGAGGEGGEGGEGGG